MTDHDAEFIRKLEKKGEEGVARDHAAGRYQGTRAALAKNWLDWKAKESDNAFRKAEIDAARESNYLAHQANWIAGGAFVLSAIAVLISYFNK